MAAFGDSIDAMRTLSVLTMVGAAVCVALLGRRLAGARAWRFPSGLVFALVPSVSRFAQEVRFYVPRAPVATLATLLLVRALDQPSGPRWLGYAASLALLGYIDLVALSVVAGHAAAGACACGMTRSTGRGGSCSPPPASWRPACRWSWPARPRPGTRSPGYRGLASTSTNFAFFDRNLFYSTSVAAALIILAILAWAVAWQEAAFMTAIAVAPVAAVWLVSQGSFSFFFPRYLLFTVGAWAILAGIGLSRLDARIAAAAVLVIAILGAGDQQVIRETRRAQLVDLPGRLRRHGYLDYAEAATFCCPPGQGR